MSLPSSIGLPAECIQSSLPDSLPQETKSWSVKIQSSSNSSVSTTFQPTNAATTYFQDIVFPSVPITFDIPCMQSPSTFIDTRMSSISFNVTYSINTAGTVHANPVNVNYPSYLRGGAYSFFDGFSVTGPDGMILENIQEFGMTYDTLCNLQMSNSVKDSVAIAYGFKSDNSVTNQGHSIALFASAAANAAGTHETHSYNFPLLSSLLGVTSERFLNAGRLNKLSTTLTTSSILHISGGIQAVWDAAPVYKVEISNVCLHLHYIDIGLQALSLLDKSLISGQQFLHGTTYRTSASNLSNVAGTQSVLTGVSGSSIKSLFFRFSPTGDKTAANGLHGKYNSFNPSINSFNVICGGVKHPQYPLNPLLNPSVAFMETMKAVGSYNNSNYQSAIDVAKYCRLSAGSAAQALTLNGQDYKYTVEGDAVDAQSQFILGVDCQSVAKRGLLNGLNASSAPIFAEINTAVAVTNPHTLYTTAMLDVIYIHDTNTGTISVRM